MLPHLDELDEGAQRKIRSWLELVGGDAERLTALALKFLHANPHVTSVLVGSKRIEHLRRNLELLDLELDAGILEKAKAIG